MNIAEQKTLIVRSLAAVPGSLSDLMERDFLKSYNPAGVDRFLFDLERENKIYEKGGKYHVYGKVKKTLEQ